METEKKVLALVPARGGSKGIKNKNTADLAGQPLISYVIEAAKASRFVTKILCTTDSETIAEVAKKYGAEVPFYRPAEMATDQAAVYPALVHAVATYEEMTGFTPDYIVTLQPTYPLIATEHIDRAIERAYEKKADSVLTVTALDHDCHPYNIRHEREDGSVKFWKEEEHYAFPTRQSKPKFFKFGNLFVTSYDTLLTKGRLEGEKNYAIEIPALYSMDINTAEDLESIARVLAHHGTTS